MNELKIILGGVTVEAKLRDGATEEVKVRQLPIDLIDQWAALQGDEAGLVELYCDKRDLATPQRLRILRTQETRLLNLINEADPEKFDELETRTAELRAKITEIENANPRWDSRLLPESHDEILRIGEELNRPTFDRWTQDRMAALGRTQAATDKLRSLLPSENSRPSAASSSAAPT